MLLGIVSQASKTTDYMLDFNVDSWPTRPGDLLDFGREEITPLTQWFQAILERAGCKISAIQDQWISLKIQVTGQFHKLDYHSLWETFSTKVPYKNDFKDVLHLVEPPSTCCSTMWVGCFGSELHQKQHQGNTECIRIGGLDSPVFRRPSCSQIRSNSSSRPMVCRRQVKGRTTKTTSFLK